VNLECGLTMISTQNRISDQKIKHMRLGI